MADAGPTSEASVSELAALAGCGEEEARFLLEANSGDLQAALRMYQEHMQAQAPQPRTRPSPRAPLPPAHQHEARQPPPRIPARPAPRSGPLSRGGGGMLARLMRFPLDIIRVTFGLAFGTMGAGFRLLSMIGHRLLPAPVLRAIKGSAEVVARSGEVVSPAVAAARFIEAFHSSYGVVCPQWHESSWQEAATRAHREFKFLLVYLHAAEHQDTDAFCKDVLCSQEVIDYILENFIAWGGDVRYSDAFSLSQSVKATTYPHVALLLGSSSRLRLVCTVSGSCTAAALKTALAQAVEDHGAQLIADRTDAQEREFNRILREQQDQEYQESLERDRRRSAELEAQRRATEEAERARQEEEARVQADAAAEERRKLEFQNALKDRRNKALDVVTEEPPAGAGACSVRIRMPNGSNLQRRFLDTNKVQALYDFVDTQEDFKIMNYNLVSNFPHCVYEGEKREMTIGSAGLAGAMLLVQSLDD